MPIAPAVEAPKELKAAWVEGEEEKEAEWSPTTLACAIAFANCVGVSQLCCPKK
jgi:hypothetical protein